MGGAQRLSGCAKSGGADGGGRAAATVPLYDGSVPDRLRLIAAFGLAGLLAAAVSGLAVRQATQREIDAVCRGGELCASEDRPSDETGSSVVWALALSGSLALALSSLIGAAVARRLGPGVGARAPSPGERCVDVKAASALDAASRRDPEPDAAELARAHDRALTELAEMRRRLAATERIAARREMARQIAHEIKNPLAPIRAAVETLRRLRARDDPAFDEYFEEATATVLKEVHRISNIVSDFTRFAKLPAPELAPVDLVEVARGVVTLHAKLPEGMGEGAPSGLRTGRAGKVVELVSEQIPEVMADRDQLVQVLTNLIQNGLEAASAVRIDPRVVVTVGPRPRLEAHSDAVAERDGASNDGAGSGRSLEGGVASHVRIVVRDNGPGVSEDMLPRLFEPYATSKDKGTGLGLAIAARIVFEHGGEIAYRHAKKGGAVFEITLPVSGPPLLDKAPAEATQRP